MGPTRQMIDRAETLRMEPGRALDALVAEGVMGWSPPRKPDKYTWQAPSGWRGGVEQIPAYSTSIAAAWEVVEKLLSKGWELDEGIKKMARLEDGGFVVEFNSSSLNPGKSRGPRAFAPTAPHAICLAALMAAGLES